jgi:hypothetical protein
VIMPTATVATGDIARTAHRLRMTGTVLRTAKSTLRGTDGSIRSANAL